MFVKIVHPGMKRTLAIAAHGEVSYRNAGEFTEREADAWCTAAEERGCDARCYVVWTGERVVLSEITIPGTRGVAPIVILTNHDTWLTNDRGGSVDRLHRHLPPDSAT